jgi:hypothetical protein
MTTTQGPQTKAIAEVKAAEYFPNDQPSFYGIKSSLKQIMLT